MESPSQYDVSDLLAMLVGEKGDPAELTSTLSHLAQTARSFFGATASITYAINPITGRIVESQVDADTNLKEDVHVAQQLLEEFIPRILRQGVVQVARLEDAPEYQNEFTQSHRLGSLVTLPLRIQHNQKPLGIVILYFKQQPSLRRDFESQEKLFQIFSTQASFILQETWLLRRHQQVARIGQEVNQEPSDVRTLFERLQRHIAGILDTSDSLMLVTYEPQTKMIDIYLKEKHLPTYHQQRPLSGSSQFVIERQETVFISHLSEERKRLPFEPSYVIGTELEESLIYVPLILHNLCLGVLSIQHPQPHAYDQQDKFILQMLANHIALALYNIRLYSSLKLLNDTGQLLTRLPDPERTLQATADRIKDATKSDVVVLYPYSKATDSFLPPPFVAGELRDPAWKEFMIPRRSDDIARLLLKREEPLFASESSTLYTTLSGDTHRPQGNFPQREGVCSTAAARLKAGDEVVGVLFVNYRQPQLFDSPQELLIEGLSHFAAIAINNARMLDKVIQRRLNELEILQKIDHELNRNLDLQSVLDTLITLTTQDVVPAEEAAIMLYDPQTQLLETASAVGSTAEERRKVKIPLSDTRGITRWVLEHKQAVRVNNVLKDERWRPIYIQAGAAMASELDVPMFDGDEMIGVLNFESSTESAFSQEDENFLTTLAGQVVLAVKKAQAYEREKRLADERRVLNEISKEIIGQLDERRILDLILERALGLTRTQWGNLMLYDPIQKDLWVANILNASEKKMGTRQNLNEGITGYVARTRKLLNQNITRPPWNEMYVELFPGTQSELAVPMLQGEELRGVLNVESPHPNNFSQVDEELLTGLADLAVITLRNADQYKKATLDARRFSLLYEAGKELGDITEYTGIDAAYDIILRIAGKHCQGQVVIRRYDNETQELVVIRAAYPQQAPAAFERMSIKEGIHGQVARERRMISIHDMRNLPAGTGPAKSSNPDTRSLVVTPIFFNERFYGTLAVGHTDIGYFDRADDQFFEALAQQLASTIFRLETTLERQEFKRRALAMEFMSYIGQSAFELTHRLGRDVGIVELWVDNIRNEMQKDGQIKAFIAERLDNIVHAAQTVLGLSNKLKSDIAHWSNYGKTTELETVEARLLLEEARSTIQLPSAPPLQIELDIAGDTGTIRVIPGSVIDILRNLIENAISAMPEGGIITLRTRNEGSYVALEVIDSGVGIPVDLQPRIFQLFFSTKGSSGFGLWSARTNAYRNGGDLLVHSQPGQGATFTLLLPRVDRKVEATS